MKKFFIIAISITALAAISVGAYAGFQWYKIGEEKKILEEEIAQLKEDIKDEEKNEEMQTIYLYYYNIEADREISESIPCSEDAVLPVEREIPLTITPIKDTLELLLMGELSEEEIAEGYQTEFPNDDFEISSLNLDDGVLYIDFTDAPDFVNGGSCRTGLLEAQIRKTALQFSEVESVEYIDEFIFQP